MSDFMELLIEGIRARPILYDTSRQDYRDSKHAKPNNWKDLASEISAAMNQLWSVESIQLKWKNTRDGYKSAKRTYERKIKSGAGAVPVPSWPYWGVMLWYDDFAKDVRTVTNIPESQDLISSNQTTSIALIEHLPNQAPVITTKPNQSSNNSTTSVTAGTSSSTTTTTSVYPSTSSFVESTNKITGMKRSSSSPSTSSDSEPPTKRKYNKLNAKSPALDFNKQMETINSQISMLNDTNTPQDTNYHYCMSLVERLRGLSSYQAIVAKRGIEDAFMHAEFETPETPNHFVFRNL